MNDDASSCKESVSSMGTQKSKPLPKRGIGRGRPAKKSPSITDSGIGQSDPSFTASLQDSRSVSSFTGKSADPSSADEKSSLPASGTCTDVEDFASCFEEVVTLGDNDDAKDVSRFSNTNCLFFEDLSRNSLKVNKYDVNFSRKISGYHKRLLFLQPQASMQFGTTLLDSANVLYASNPIPRDKQVLTINIEGERIIVTLRPSVRPLVMADFFSCLLSRASMYLVPERTFVPKKLLPDNLRYEVYPGQVLDVSEREHIVRCSTDFDVKLGTVEDVLEECMVYAAVNKILGEADQIAAKALADLFVFNKVDKNSYIVVNILWDLECPKYSHMVHCKKLNSETVHYFSSCDLLVAGSRRATNVSPGFNSGELDKLASFRGLPATGQQRQLALIRYRDSMSHGPARNYLDKWGIKLVDTVVISNGVVLESEMLLMDGNYSSASSRGWVERLSDVRVLSPVRVSKWFVIFEQGDLRLAKQMAETLVAEAPTIGIEMRQPRLRAVTDDSAKSYEVLLSSCLKAHPDLEVIIVILRASREDIYRTVKKWSLLGYSKPITTQFVKRETAKLLCHSTEYCYSVISQINCKLGGALWAVENVIDNTLVIGLSLYVSKEGEAVLGFVAATNKMLTQWYSFTMVDPTKEFPEQIRIAIRKYFKNNGNQNPERIIVLSNAIEDDSFVDEIEKHFRAAYKGKLTFAHIVDEAEYNNLVIELATAGRMDELTQLQRKYILVPGGANNELRMICCCVEINDSGLSRNSLLKTIQRLKHNYYNVAGEAKLPAPVLYAARCAEFVCESLEGEQSTSICDVLYYL